MPFFSIIIPVFNKGNFIEQTLKSVLAQTFENFEIIIVNDGSTDGSEEKILAFSDKRINYFSKKNEGVAITRNFGIEKAKGSFICFLDADDYWHPTFLKIMHHYTMKFPQQKIFACAIELETQNKCFLANYSIPKKNDFEIVNFFGASRKNCVLWTSSIAINKDVFTHVGTFDENLKVSEDTDLWIRIGLHYDIVFIWQILARYVFDAQSISRNTYYILEDIFLDKYRIEEQNNPLLKQYMDLNRFSTAIKYLLIENFKMAQEIQSEINLQNLSWKKRFLLQLPPRILRILVKTKSTLADIGLGNSVFK